jgi:hypothetical protein
MTSRPLEERVDELAGQIGKLQGRIDTLAAGMVTVVTESASPVRDDVEVQELSAQVERLQHRIDELANGMVRVATEVAPDQHPAVSGEKEPASGEETDGIVAWAGTSSLLPRISTLCFLLVVALMLRTVTDSGIIGKHVGSLAGMVYAAAIMAVGWLRYRKGSPIAPVFSLSGAILMFTIIVETHSRFGSLPTAPAYLLLAGTGVAMAGTGRTAGSRVPTAVGILGMCLAGVAINFPLPSLPFLALLLLLANTVAYLATPGLKRDWLRWLLFFLTAAVVQVWSFRLQVILGDPDFPSPPLHLSWFLPVTALLALFFFATSILGMVRSREGDKRPFDYVVPAMSALVYFTAARHVALPLWESGIALGVVGFAAATAHLGVASWMVRGKTLGTLEFNSFTVAAVVWLVLALSAATGALLVALPFISGAALHLATISDRWQSGGTRAISYLMQVFVALALSMILLAGQTAISPLFAALAAGAVAVLSLLHYRWSRDKTPPADSFYFSRVDRRDYSGVTLLLASLTGWFFLFRVVAAQVLLRAAGTGDVTNALSGVQSILINAAAILFLVLSYLRRNRELRNVAILVTLVGAGKVFLYDLVGVEGLPRVFSVFSFGIVAATASWVLGRWQRGDGPEEGREGKQGAEEAPEAG